MARDMTARLGEKDRTLTATFGASMEIAKKVGDPLLFAKEIYKAETLLGQGLNYEPRFKLTIENVPQIVHAGLKAAGSKALLEDVQEWCFDLGMVDASSIAIEYLMLLVTPAPKDAGEGGGEGKP